MPFPEIDILDLINHNAKRHGFSEEAVGEVLREIDHISGRLNIEPESLYMIFLDSISGDQLMTSHDLVHQMQVALNNHNITRFFSA